MKTPVKQFDNVLIIKVGTTTLFRHENGRELLDHESFRRIAQQVVRLREQGFHIAIISSGAVTAGMEATGTTKRPAGDEAMPETQRLASIGWHRILQTWEQALNGIHVGGLLITRRELNLDTPEHDEVLRTTHTLLSHNDIPILNENDGITHSELSHQSFGQNDTLSAIYAAQIARSQLFGKHVRLVLLSDVDGVYANMSDSESILREIRDLNEYEHLAGDSAGQHGRGGMKTKFEAAKIAAESGVEVWVANGRTENVIQLALEGKAGTHFTL